MDADKLLRHNGLQPTTDHRLLTTDNCLYPPGISRSCHCEQSAAIFSWTNSMIAGRFTVAEILPTIENRLDSICLSADLTLQYGYGLAGYSVLCDTEKRRWFTPYGRQSAVSRRGNCRPRKWT